MSSSGCVATSTAWKRCRRAIADELSRLSGGLADLDAENLHNQLGFGIIREQVALAGIAWARA